MAVLLDLLDTEIKLQMSVLLLFCNFTSAFKRQKI